MYHTTSKFPLLFLVAIGWHKFAVVALQEKLIPRSHAHHRLASSRRETLGRLVSACGAAFVSGLSPLSAPPSWAASAVQDSMNVDAFLRSGVDAGGNMGVSSQAGKSKPETGVFLR